MLQMYIVQHWEKKKPCYHVNQTINIPAKSIMVNTMSLKLTSRLIKVAGSEIHNYPPIFALIFFIHLSMFLIKIMKITEYRDLIFMPSLKWYQLPCA